MTVYRTGRHNHRTIYVQLGDVPERSDVQVGTMDTPELGVLVVALLNAHEQCTQVGMHWYGQPSSFAETVQSLIGPGEL